MIIGLLFIALAVMATFGWLVFGGVLKLERDQNRAERNADQILDGAFTGEPDVTFPLNMRSLKPETVVLGAKRRGYKLIHESSNQYGPTAMIFEKTAV